MSRKKTDLLVKNLEMAIIAMDTLDEMVMSDETQIFDSTLRNRMFIQNIEAEVVKSIFNSTSEVTMAYLKNSSYYLKDAMSSLGVIASSGSLEGEVNLTNIKNDVVKGVASYVFFITALSAEFLNDKDFMESIDDEDFQLVTDTIKELKDMIEERDLFNKYKGLNYYEEKNLEVVMEGEDADDDDDNEPNEINDWKGSIDLDDFKES